MAPSQIGRLLYGSVLAYSAGDNVQNLDARVGYAEAKGVPMPDVLVPAASGLLFLGSMGIILWRLPRLAAAAVALFLLGVTPTMHDFWNHEGQQRSTEKFQFLKNVAMLGTALMLFASTFSTAETDNQE